MISTKKLLYKVVEKLGTLTGAITASGTDLSVAGDITVQGHSSPIGTVYSAETTKTISNTDIDSPTSGASITVPAGTYSIVGQWGFGTRSSSGTTNSECQIYNSTASEILGRNRVFASANNWNVLSCSWVATFTEETTLYVRGATSKAYTSATTNTIRAVRIA